MIPTYLLPRRGEGEKEKRMNRDGMIGVLFSPCLAECRICSFLLLSFDMMWGGNFLTQYPS
ncbi:hypothetical protein K449DRAFT_252404 [Hypoxylon sp. EC38]|nr:hypothetical protein K449DRAFT_252404 [Hypoxylon sp. EC38]